jgi:hypothetical protein
LKTKKGPFDPKSHNFDLLKQLHNNQLSGSNTILGLPEHSPSLTSTHSSASNHSNNSSIKATRKSIINSNTNVFSPTSTINTQLDTSATSRRNTSDKQSTLFVIAKNPTSPQSTLPLNNNNNNNNKNNINQNKLDGHTSSSNFSGHLEQDLVIEPLSKFGILIQIKLLEEKVLLYSRTLIQEL